MSILDLFSLLCGLAIFLYGMQKSEKSLRRIGGQDLRKVISVITHHRISAYLAGLGTTLVTQSSSATTVLLVGLASARLMTLNQSLGMILGADLGTTFTVQLFAFKFYEIAPLLIALGFLVSLSAKQRLSLYGSLILSLGFIFFGMHMMSDAATPLHASPTFEHLILVSLTNPWVGLFAGTFITSMIHSSAATLTIIIALGQAYQSGSDWIPAASNYFPLVLGANLGTCATALLSMLRADTEGMRVAWAHLFFKLIGTAIVFPVTFFGSSIDNLITGSPAIQIAELHTIFNLFISMLFLPLLSPFGNFINSFVKPSKRTDRRFQTTYLNENVLKVPTLAISQSAKEIERMFGLVFKMIEGSRELIGRYDFRLKSHTTEADDEVDFLHEQIVTFLTKMSKEELHHEQSSRSYELVMVATDLEHIGDIVSKSLVTLSEKIESSPLPLSDKGKAEINEFFEKTVANFNDVFEAFSKNDLEQAGAVFGRKAEMLQIFDKLFDRHMDRLYGRNPESLKTTSIHVDLLEEIQRINHFTFRIAAHLLKIHNAE